METIIAPIDRQLIKSELTSDRFLRTTRKGGNEIYIVNCYNAPNTLQKIGRLREEAFRNSGMFIAVDDIMEDKRVRYIDTYAHDKLFPSVE